MVISWLQRRGRALLLLAGLMVTALALTVDLLRFGRWQPIGIGQAALIAAGLALLGAGWWLQPQFWQGWRTLGRRLRALYLALAVLVLNTLILVLVFEVASLVLLRQGVFDGEVGTDVSAGDAPPWANAYWREHEATGKKRYEPYLVWRSPPFGGETINIDGTGRRLTPGAVCEEGAFRVFTFGGSAMWGHGVPDWETIPAHLQARLAAVREGPVCVRNFAERGYVATQGLVALTLALQAGDVPDLVIFYDGANDLAASLQSGAVGAHLNLDEIATTFERPWLGLMRQSYTMKLVRQLAVTPGDDLDPEQYEQVARAALQRYRETYEVVAALAGDYDFAYSFFWQPLIIVGERPLTAPEQTIAAAFPPHLLEYYETGYGLAAALEDDLLHFHYLADVFAEKTEPVWLDGVHLLPAGNRIVAAHMLEVIATE